MLRCSLIIVLALVGACARDQAELALASRAVGPHLSLFGDFDLWARRARASATQRSSLAETSFAPLRLERSVLGAWIEVDAGHPAMLSLPADTARPAAADWIALRDAKLGELAVRVERECSVNVPGWWRPAPEHGCVLIQREAPTAVGEAMRVTMAFAFDAVEAPNASLAATAARR